MAPEERSKATADNLQKLYKDSRLARGATITNIVILNRQLCTSGLFVHCSACAYKYMLLTTPTYAEVCVNKENVTIIRVCANAR